jgi:hypothetical protein
MVKKMRAFVGCIALVLAVGPAWARDFGIYGSNEGQLSRDECPAGQYLVGVLGNTGSWIDQITVVCAELKPDNTFGTGRTLPSRGGSGGAYKKVTCDGKDESITRISMGRTPDYQITYVYFSCMSFNAAAEPKYKVFAGTRNSAAISGEQVCAAGERATGLTIRHGQFVNGVALICGALPTAATCQAGMVWRDSFEGDAFCVTPDERYRLPDGTCRSGYVWRDTFPGDNVCVTPQKRATAKGAAAAQKTLDNQLACQSYADRSLEQIAEAEKIGCEISGDFWKADRQYQLDNCLGHGTSAAYVAGFNLDAREATLQSCRQKSADPATPVNAATATVTADVDLYDSPGGTGKVIGLLSKGDVVPFGGCREDGWCEVTGRGWVWGEYLAR